MKVPLTLAVLLSGTGRTLENLLSLRDQGLLAFDLGCVVSSRPGVRGLEVARRGGCEPEVIARRDCADLAAYGRRLSDLLLEREVDLVVLAGFLVRFLAAPELEGRIVNIHPSLLPAFGGKGLHGHRVHEAVLAAGVKVSGCTVHFIDDDYDHGPIILQRTVPVYYGDDADRLAARVFQEECRALPDAIRLFAAGRLRIDDGRVELLPPA
jgi:formyltetrahydrofolate-dependent phosphoribosylglycinamide formyltransferase